MPQHADESGSASFALRFEPAVLDEFEEIERADYTDDLLLVGHHDVVDLVRLLYDAVGGKKHYASQPPEIKAICKGLRRDLIGKAFPTARHLREYLEAFKWGSA